MKSTGFGKTSPIATKKRFDNIKKQAFRNKARQPINNKPITQVKKSKTQTSFLGKGRISQSVTRKRNLNLAKKHQNVVKAPNPVIKNTPSKGLTKLKNTSLKNQPAKRVSKTKVPSKGIQLLQKKASNDPKIVNKSGFVA